MEQHERIGNRVVRHTKWIMLAPVATKLLGLGATIVLARILSPNEFGLLAYAGTALTFFSMFQDLGITQALVAHRGDVSEKLLPALTMSFLSGIAFYAVLLAMAIPLSRFLEEPLLAPILTVMGSIVVLQTSAQVHHALLVRQERYRALFVIAIMQSIVYLSVAIGLAVTGRGVWSLVLGLVAAQATRTVGLWLASGWLPGRGPRGRLVSPELLRFGGALTLVNILDWAADGWVFMSVGKMLGSEALGMYNVTFEASRMSYFGLSALAGSVVLTSYSSLLDDAAELRRLMFKGLRIVTTAAYPAAIGICALAPWIVPLVWGSKWLDAIPILAILAVHGLVAPIATVFFPFFVSTGRLGLLIRINAVRLVAYIIFVGLATRVDVVTVAATHLALMVVMTGILAAVAMSAIGAQVSHLRGAVLWPALRAGICGLAAFGVARALDGQALPVVLIPAVLTGVLVYVASLYLSDRDAFFEAASVFARGGGVKRRDE